MVTACCVVQLKQCYRCCCGKINTDVESNNPAPKGGFVFQHRPTHTHTEKNLQRSAFLLFPDDEQCSINVLCSRLIRNEFQHNNKAISNVIGTMLLWYATCLCQRKCPMLHLSKEGMWSVATRLNQSFQKCDPTQKHRQYFFLFVSEPKEYRSIEHDQFSNGMLSGAWRKTPQQIAAGFISSISFSFKPLISHN